eukprot:m.170235 g.170235  ORF g.170235 m.170235 type:complete len:53 (+) comp31605_c2_seq1:302-460(+)
MLRVTVWLFCFAHTQPTTGVCLWFQPQRHPPSYLCQKKNSSMIIAGASAGVA